MGRVSKITFSVEGIGSVQVGMLESSAGFSTWHKDIYEICESKGLWSLIDGTEQVVDEPRPLDANAKRFEREAYNHDRAVFNKQQPRARMATSILRQSVCNTIRDSVAHLSDPKAIFNHIKFNYAPPGGLGTLAALKKMEEVTYKNSRSNVTGFVKNLRNARQEIVASGFKYDNILMVSKLQRGLPKEFSDFIIQRIDTTDEVPDFDELVPMLLSFEVRQSFAAKD